ncbi:MAG: 3-keto-disaccharide hydrolase, partial [Planctomycetota bacterium]
ACNKACAADWTSLFDGKTLDGWSVHSGKCKFEVEDGVIVGTSVEMSTNTFLCTNRTYGDFVLELEVKCDPELNSGVQVRSEIAERELGFTFLSKQGKLRTVVLPKDRVYGYQVEVANAESGKSGGIYDEARRFYFLDELEGKPEAQAAFRNGQWNTYRIECRGDRLRTWVNEVPCANVRDAVTPRGIIGLQVHGQVALSGHKIHDDFTPRQVRFRNIRIQELAP